MKRLAVWVVVSLLALAQPTPQGDTDCSFIVHTFPAGAKIWLARGQVQAGNLNNIGSAPAGMDFLGVTGQAVPHRNLSTFRDKSTQKLSVPLVLTLDGHEDFRVTADDDLLLGRWPQDGTITLRPRNWRVAAFDALRRYWPAFLAVGLAGVVALVQVRRRRALQRQNLELVGLQHEGDPLLGSLVGQYRILSMLGAGGMAVVYRARRGDSADADVVALKVVAPQMAADPEFTGRFRREVQAYMKLDHPNIVRLLDWGMQPPYLVMELVDGVTLREVLKQGPVAVQQALEWLGQTLEGMAYAHSQGLVHRDLKPDNVMLQKGKLIKIMDFGLARTQEVTSNLTGSGNVLGTPAYIAPEQIEGLTNPSADQYSLGIMAYEMLAGRPPFVGEPMKVLLAHLSDPIPPLGQFRENLPPELEAIVMRMVRKDPAERFDNLLDVWRALQRVR